MKKIMKLFVYVAAAAMALASCQKNEMDRPVNDGVQFTINAGIAETKTVITDNGNGTYTPSWDGTESLAVLFELPNKETEAKDATKFTNQTGKGTTSKFSATVTNVPENGTLYAVSPYDAFGRGFEGGIARLDLNHEQKPTATSFDPACDILVAKPYDYAVVDGAVEVDPLYFTRVMSVLKVNLKSNFEGIKNENVESIKFSTGGVEITGYAKVSLENPAFAGEWTTKYDYVTATYESETISVNGENNSVYFVVAPVTIPVEKELTFTIKTTNYSITKTVKEHPEMTFSAGNVSVINLNIKEDECTSLSGGDDADRYYEKVTSAPADWSGKYLIVYEGTPAYLDGSLTPGKSAGQIGSTAGMISTIISNDRIASSEEVDKSIIMVEKSGTGYALKASSGKYMGMSGNDNGMKNSDNASDYVHTISLNTDNSVTLLSSDGNTKLAYNKNSSYFRYYKVTTINGQPSLYPLPVLYRLVDTNEGGGETPEPKVLKSIAVSDPKTNYVVGDEFIKPNVTATYDDDITTKDVTTLAAFGGYDMRASGTQTVTVSYTEGEKTATATYQITVVESQNLPEGIASIKSKAISTTDTEFAVVLTDAVVTYVSGSNAYIEDAEAGILIYKSGHGLKAGDKLNGEVSGKVKLYSNLREITDIDYSQATKTEGAEVPVTEVTLAQLNGAYDKYENMRIKIVDAHVSAEKQISQGDQTYALYFKGQSLTGFDVYNIIDVIGYPTKYNSNIQLNVWENAVVKGATKTTITGISDVTVKVGETKAINAKASSGAKVSYVSAHPSVAKVGEDGTVTGVAEGETTITVSVPAYNGYPAAEEVCNVKVTAASLDGGDEPADVYVFTADDITPEGSFSKGVVNDELAYKLGSSTKTGTLIFPAGYSEITLYAVGWTSGTNKLTIENGTIVGQNIVTLKNDAMASGNPQNGFEMQCASPDGFAYTINVTDITKSIKISLKRGVVWGFHGVSAN